MKLSTGCRYGIRALLEIARQYGQQPVTRREIGYRQSISPSYLENILLLLKKSGLITSVRGARGGFSLARAPTKINLLEIFRVLEGPLEPVNCLVNPKSCERFPQCVTRTVWQQMYTASEKILRDTTIQTLLDRENNELSLD